MNSITFEDAVIFLGIKCAESETGDYFAKLVGYLGDIDQLVPGYDEFISAYNKLLYISAIKNEQGRVVVMEFGNVIYKSALSKSQPNAPLREIAELICIALKPYKLKSACRQSPVSVQEYEAAVKLYQAGKLPRT